MDAKWPFRCSLFVDEWKSELFYLVLLLYSFLNLHAYIPTDSFVCLEIISSISNFVLCVFVFPFSLNSVKHLINGFDFIQLRRLPLLSHSPLLLTLPPKKKEKRKKEVKCMLIFNMHTHLGVCCTQAQASLHNSWLGGGRGGGPKNCLSPCPARGSNPGSLDLNSDALTTELFPPTSHACVSVCQSEEEKLLQKQIRREEKRLNKKDSKKVETDDLKAMAFDPQEMKMAR